MWKITAGIIITVALGLVVLVVYACVRLESRLDEQERREIEREVDADR
jgi:hypothetical protein